MTEIFKKYNISTAGTGNTTLLFAHGFGCDQNSWNYIKDAFVDDHKVVLFDYVGAGKSDKSCYNVKKYDSLNGYADDVIEICESLQLKDAIFVGHSVSCMIGALATIKRPDLFKKLVFIGPSPCFITAPGYPSGFDRETIDTLMEVMDEDYISWARSLAPNIMGTSHQAALGDELTDSFCATDAHIAKQFARVTFYSDNRAELPLIPIPSLTIQSTQDLIVPVTVGEYIHKHTPQNTLRILNTQGHCPHMSKPAETIAIIKSFI